MLCLLMLNFLLNGALHMVDVVVDYELPPLKNWCSIYLECSRGNERLLYKVIEVFDIDVEFFEDGLLNFLLCQGLDEVCASVKCVDEIRARLEMLRRSLSDVFEKFRNVSFRKYIEQWTYEVTSFVNWLREYLRNLEAIKILTHTT